MTTITTSATRRQLVHQPVAPAADAVAVGGEVLAARRASQWWNQVSTSDRRRA